MTRLGGATATLTMLLAVFVIGCGGSDGASQEELDQARKEGAQQAREQARMDALEAKLKQLSKQNKNNSGGTNTNGGSNSGGSSPSGLTACADGVSAGPNTTCAFAMNVAGEYGSNPGATTISAYSPVTDKYYTMTCSAYSAGHVCIGGNGAEVYLP